MTLISANLREAVARRAGQRCEYCRLSQETQVATFPVDHIFPVVEGGETNLENLAMACPRCNAAKWTHYSNVDPISGTVVPLFHPRTQSWTDHFRWSESDPTIVEALSAVGRATLSLLEINGARHLQVRRWLIVLGLHPPSDTTGV